MRHALRYGHNKVPRYQGQLYTKAWSNWSIPYSRQVPWSKAFPKFEPALGRLLPRIVGPYFGNAPHSSGEVRTDPTCKRGYSCRGNFLPWSLEMLLKKRTLTKQVGMGRNLHVVVDILSSPMFFYFILIFQHIFSFFWKKKKKEFLY